MTDKIIEVLLEQLKLCVGTCERALEMEDQVEAVDVCLDRLANAQGTVCETYTSLWSSLGIPWFDHRYDWLRGPRWWAVWQERGIVGLSHIFEGARVLDLCCGDGIFAGLFYGQKAGVVHGIDRNGQAIALARKYYAEGNVEFFCQDVMDEWPLSEYDVIACFAAIEHFSVEGGHALLEKVIRALSEDGVFVGSTPVVALEDQGSGNPEHDNEFESAEQLRDFLSAHFGTVKVWSSPWGSRMDMYFVCENG